MMRKPRSRLPAGADPFPSTRRSRGWMRLAAAILLLGIGGCDEEPPPPNVLFLLVDTLRADHLAHHGYERDVSPRLSELAARSVVFRNHYSHASRTGPAVASIFTGLHPRSHGVVNPLTAFDAKGTLADEQTTLAEILSSHGYACHGITANPNVTARFGFGQGFETYDFLPAPTAAGLRRVAEAELRGRTEPFLLFLHFMDPHSPYAAPAEYRGLWTDPGYRGPIDGSHRQLDEIVAGRLVPDDADRARLEALYDQEIRFFDDQLGELLDMLDAEGLSQNTVIVFVADHGEEFLDHGSVLHGYTLYEEQLRVPFLLHDPRTGHAREVKALTRHVDLLPTLLAVLGIPAEGDLQGRDLGPLMAGEPGDDRGVPVFAQASLRAVRTVQAQSFLLDGWKLIRTQLPAEREELYHVADDPGERIDLFASRPEIANDLRDRMETFVASLPVAEGGVVRLTEEEIRRLRALGYIR